MSIPKEVADKLLRAENHGHLPSMTALRNASLTADATRRDCDRRQAEADSALTDAWESLDAALSLTALGEIDREEVISLAMNTFGPRP